MTKRQTEIIKKQAETIRRLKYNIKSLKIWLKTTHEQWMDSRQSVSNAVFKVAELSHVPIQDLNWRP